MASPSTCVCGAQLEQPKGSGRPRKWCSETCRKTHCYGGKCIDCGARTSYSARAGNRPSLRCPSCATEAGRVWPKERIIERIQTFAAEQGRPPVSGDWNPGLLKDAERRAEAERLLASGEWPQVFTVQRVFGSWNAAIAAAGFVPLPQSSGRRHSRAVAA